MHCNRNKVAVLKLRYNLDNLQPALSRICNVKILLDVICAQYGKMFQFCREVCEASGTSLRIERKSEVWEKAGNKEFKADNLRQSLHSNMKCLGNPNVKRPHYHYHRSVD